MHTHYINPGTTVRVCDGTLGGRAVLAQAAMEPQFTCIVVLIDVLDRGAMTGQTLP
jgi:hypothetical protein